MGWLEYWNDKPTVYVSRRHREAHGRSIADGLIGHLGSGEPTVLDFGCGEALEAERVAARCRHLYLCDGAASVREGLASRLGHVENVTVLSVDDVDGLANQSIDLVVANSVVQYLDADSLDRLLANARRLLKADGRLLIADVIPRDVGPLTDALALLSFARREGFLVEAVVGLGRTFFSSYRRVRTELGLRQYGEAEFGQLLAAPGFAARRVHRNIGHNQSRMTFIATLAGRRTDVREGEHV